MAAVMKNASCTARLAARPTLPTPVRVRVARSINLVRTHAVKEQDAVEIGRTIGLASVAASWMMAGNANAAAEISQLAASDNRVGIIFALFVPAVGWVAYNIAQPFSSQLGRMDELKRSIPAALGLGAAAAILMADKADAATEITQLAASDSRLGIIAFLFLPALGWVAYNMAQPLTSQLSRMDELKRSVPAALGLGAAASLLMAEKADAVTEISQLAASDSRLGIIFALFLPALGWVAYNMAQPLTSQLSRMDEMK